MGWITSGLFTCLLLSNMTYAQSVQKRIALTYDDAPLADSFLSGKKRAAALISGLKEARVSQAAFFITTQGINSPRKLARIQSYATAGHVIANHSHTHPWLRNVTSSDYLANIDRAEETLALFENRRSWFRYPYLNEAPNKEKRDAIRQGLKARKIKNGYVTVDTFDWYLNSLFQEAKKQGQNICLPALSKLYTDMMVGAANFFNKAALETIGRSPAHTLLLHENDIAALFVLDLVNALKGDGWTIITADEAYNDPIADIEPDTLFLGQGRVAAIASTKGRTPQSFSHFAVKEDQIKKAFEADYGVFNSCTSK